VYLLTVPAITALFDFPVKDPGGSEKFKAILNPITFCSYYDSSSFSKKF